MKVENKLFREKNLERISSPERLEQYIKTTTPSVWILMIAIFLLLVGAIIWGSVGKVQTKVNQKFMVQNGTAIAFLDQKTYQSLQEDSVISINGTAYEITTITGPYQADETTDSYLLFVSGMQVGSWFYMVEANTDLGEGEYEGFVVLEEISPISFIING